MRGRFQLVNAKFYILLALADGPKHGLAIQWQIVGDSMGVYVRASTIYAALGALVRDGLAEAAGVGDGYRKEYRITGMGRRILGLEVGTLQETLGLAVGRLR